MINSSGAKAGRSRRYYEGNISSVQKEQMKKQNVNLKIEVADGILKGQ